MRRVILVSPCKPVFLQHKWGSHGLERLGGFPMVTQLPKAAGQNPAVLTTVLNQIYHSLPPPDAGPWPPSSLRTKWRFISYLSQGVVLIPRINGPQLITKPDAWDARALSYSPHRFPNLGKNKPLSTNFIFQKNWMGVSITTIHPCFDQLLSVPSIQIWLRTSNYKKPNNWSLKSLCVMKIVWMCLRAGTGWDVGGFTYGT